ncbi:MAG: WG repeat-containing protein [Cytophagaceae bacterium]|nr:WG repeat-containing protein [Cytophagaceae bacterium]MDW8455355.1 WG repeat-containing protein [Cytophagaceae bacterium]
MNVLTYIVILTLSAFFSKAQQGYVIFQEHDGKGLKDTNGKIIIPAEYSDIQKANASFYAVKHSKGLWGFYYDGKKIADCLYDNFKEGIGQYIIAQKNYRWGVLKKNGQILVPFIYKYINPLSANACKVQAYNQWQVRTFDNKVKKTYEYDSIEYLGDNVYKFCIAARYGLMDADGNVITTEYQEIFEPTLKKNYSLDKIKPFTENDTTLNTFSIPGITRFEKVFAFHEGLAKVYMNGKYGFIDSSGNIRLVPQYNDAYHFSDGMVAVKLLGKWGFMDTQEKLRVQPNYEQVFNFKNGAAIVRNGNQWNFINKQGQKMYHEDFSAIWLTHKGHYILMKNNRYGMADAEAHEIISTKYEQLIPLNNGFIMAKEHQLWGVLDQNGAIVIPFNYSAMQYDPEHDCLITMESSHEKTIKIYE